MAKQKKKLSDTLDSVADDVSREDFYTDKNKEEDQSIKDCILDMEHIIEVNAPDGKGVTDCNGGYIQQLTQSKVLYLFYGNDKNNNSVTETIELKTFQEYFYIRDIFDIYMYYIRDAGKRKRNKLSRRVK